MDADTFDCLSCPVVHGAPPSTLPGHPRDDLRHSNVCRRYDCSATRVELPVTWHRCAAIIVEFRTTRYLACLNDTMQRVRLDSLPHANTHDMYKRLVSRHGMTYCEDTGNSISGHIAKGPKLIEH